MQQFLQFEEIAISSSFSLFFSFFFKLGNDGSFSVQHEFLEWEKVKEQKLEEYRARKLEFYNTLINNQEEIIN
jgi:hypothetical protein